MICKDSPADQTVDEDVMFTHLIIGHGIDGGSWGIQSKFGSQVSLSGQKMAQNQGIQHEHMGQLVTGSI